jgi:hypothetical protein
MGSDSLLQGDFSTTLEMTSRDWGILRSRIQPVEWRLTLYYARRRRLQERLHRLVYPSPIDLSDRP